MQIRQIFIAAFIVCIVVLTSMVVLADNPAQGCVVRTDWPTYTVVRGDTLARIARRFNTTYPVLAAANCISNPWRIYSGQRIHVPSGGSPIPDSRVDIPSTFQAYENGFMIWRGDNGMIWVFSNDGRVSTFPSSSYGRLPENRISSPPSKRVIPIMGFGRVWGNYSEVRARLGWATTIERSYVLMVQNVGASAVTYMTIPTDTRWIQVNANNTWTYTSGVRPTPQPINTPIPVGDVDTFASFQQFENGFMTWRADTGEIAVYFGVNGGTASGFIASAYSGLPDNPIFNPPAGRVRPIQGFGKVWGNYDWVRNQLGWATGHEQGYVMYVRQTMPPTTGFGGAFTFNLPDGRRVSNTRNSFWGFTDGGPLPASPTPTIIPSITPVPTDQVSTTQAAFQQYEQGMMIWRADNNNVIVFYGHGSAAIYQYENYNTLPDNPFGGDTPDGRVRPINAFGRVWGNFDSVRNQLGWATQTEQSYSMTVTARPDAVFYSTPDGRHLRYQLATGTWGYANP